MLVVILGIAIISLIIGIIIFNYSDLGIELCGIGTTVLIIALIPTFIGITRINTKDTMLEKIAMYEQENLEMEESIASAIEKYLEHEKNIFIEIKPNETQTYLVAYPELQASELVKYQLGVLKDNTEQIKLLKNDIYNIEICKFVLYFG